MRILLTHRPGGAYGYISESWKNCLVEQGRVAERWDGTPEHWRAFRPDVYIGCSGHRQPIPANRDGTKVAIHVNPYGSPSIPGIDESAEAIAWVLAQKPDAVFGYGHESDRHFWSNWTAKHGIPWVPLPTAGDPTIFRLPALENRLVDVGYVGGCWPYKSQTMLEPMRALLRSGLSVSICGNGWPLEFHATSIADDQVCDFLGQCKIGVCLSEVHTHIHGIDLPERLWKVALCGALVVHDDARDLWRHMPSALVAKNPAEFVSHCRHFVGNESARQVAARRCRQDVLTGNTYSDRMKLLLRALGGEKAKGQS